MTLICSIIARTAARRWTAMNKQKQERAERKAEIKSKRIEKRKPIYDAYMRGATLRKISAEYGMSPETVRQMVNAERRRLRMTEVEHTSDRVAVCRCDKCIYYRRNVHDRGDDSYCAYYTHETRKDDYCSRAIRRPKEGQQWEP